MTIQLPVTSIPAITLEDFLKFRDFFYRKTGIMFPENKRYFVDKRIQEQILGGGFVNFRDYFKKVSLQAHSAELQELVNAMTVNETYFYREDYQLACLVRSILPELIKPLSRGAPLKIWSLPCSTGEEPYSIALYLLEHWNDVDDFNIEIIGSDIDTEVLTKAKTGIYEDRALQYLSKETIKKYFSDLGAGNYQLIKEIRNSIKFTQANIMETAGTNVYQAFDVVFCRNLLIYFDDVSRQQAVERIFAALNPGGFVCLGHSESMSRISTLFEMRKFHEAIVYQKPIHA